MLVYAALWRGKFPDGRVTHEAFGKFGQAIPRSNDKNRAKVAKAYIRKGLQELGLNAHAIGLERQAVGTNSQGRDPRERATWLAVPLADGLEEWFTTFGVHYLRTTTEQEIVDSGYGLRDALPSLAMALESSTADAYLSAGRLRDAQVFMKQAAERAFDTTHGERYELILATAHLLKAADPAIIDPVHPVCPLPISAPTSPSLREAITILEPFATSPLTPDTPAHRQLRARVLLSLAVAQAARAAHTPTPDLTTARRHLSAARGLIDPCDHSLLGEYFLARYRIEHIAFKAASLEDDDDESQRCLSLVSYALQRAAGEFCAGRNWDLLRPVVLNLGSVLLLLPKMCGQSRDDLIRWYDVLWSYWDAIGSVDSVERTTASCQLLSEIAALPPRALRTESPLSDELLRRLVDRSATDVDRLFNSGDRGQHCLSGRMALARIRRRGWYRGLKDDGNASSGFAEAFKEIYRDFPDLED